MAPSTTPIDFTDSGYDAAAVKEMTRFKPLPGVTRIMVTGGAGFLGSWVVRGLTRTYGDCYDLISFDKIDFNATINNTRELEGRPNFTFVHGDITSPEEVMDCLRTYEIDVILHFAALSSVDASFTNAYAFGHANIHGTQVLLECARVHQVKRFIHVSTDEVYGEVKPNAAEFLEGSALSPTNPYSASKAAAEMFVTAYAKSFRIPVIIVRSNNVYGPHQFPEKIIPKFTLLLNRGLKLPLYGTGLNTRRYLYAGDAADAFNTVLHRGTLGEVYNLGSSDEVNNRHLCDILFALVDPPVKDGYGSDAWIQPVADRPFHDRAYGVDDSKIRSLGWKQNVSFEDGLRRTVDWYLRYGESWWGDLEKILVPDS